MNVPLVFILSYFRYERNNIFNEKNEAMPRFRHSSNYSNFFLINIERIKTSKPIENKAFVEDFEQEFEEELFLPVLIST